MDLNLMTWNLFHGRDAPPAAVRASLGRRISGRPERSGGHLQITSDLSAEFHAHLAKAEWDVCLLQECPPRWRRSLEEACGADSFESKTSRNWLGPLTGAIASHRPDLMASWEGGSNLILVRGRAGGILDSTTVTLARRPERRTLALVRLGCGAVAGCLHLSTEPGRAASEALIAAVAVTGWANEDQVVLGGDFNLRPGDGGTYETLEQMGLYGALAGSIDQLLTSSALDPPAIRWEESWREVVRDGLALRLSDHAPVSRSVLID